jgi:hypothetical protein
LLLQQQPDFTVSDYRRNHPAATFKVGQMVAEALCASGLPE